MKNFAELKRNIRVGRKFVVVYHWRDELVGKCRVISEVHTNCFYSVVENEPDNKWSLCNNGKGCRTDLYGAKCWKFNKDFCTLVWGENHPNSGTPIMTIKFV